MNSSKYLHIIGIIFTGILILFYYNQSIVDNKSIYEIEKKISTLREIESHISYDYFILKSSKIKHFDKIRDDFNLLKNETTNLRNLSIKLKDKSLIDNIDKYIKKLEQKERIFNKLISHTAVNNNFKSFFQKLVKDYSDEFKLSNVELSLNILKVQTLFISDNLKEINSLLDKLKTSSYELHYLNEQKINYFIEYTNAFISNYKSLDRLEKRFLRINLYSHLDSVVDSLNLYFHNMENKSKQYETLMLIMVGVLFLWILYFLLLIRKANKKIDETIHELNFQKYALDQHAIVSVADIKGNITYVNDKFINISQYTKDELLGRNHRVLKSNEHDNNYFKKMWNTISGGKIWNGQIKNQKKDGTYYWVESTIVPFLNNKGEPFRYISIRTDITKQKEIENELIISKNEADRLNNVKSEFLANMSHELRTPLNGVLGLTKIVLDNETNSKQKSYLEKIYASGNILLKIINDLLDYSKIEAGKLNFEKTQFELDSLLGTISHLLSVKAYEKNLKLYFDKDMNIPNILIGDSLRISQVLMNIIGNSIKFTDSGDVHLSIKLNQIDEDKLNLEFIIKDTGIGMSKETLENIFESFAQADVSTTRKYGGTGLGLSISKNLVELMGGEIKVESTLGEGSEFTFVLPFEYEKIKEKNSFDNISIYLYKIDETNQIFIENIFKNKDIKYSLCKELPNSLSTNEILITEEIKSIDLDNYSSIIQLCEIENKETTHEKIKQVHMPIIASSLINKLTEFVNIEDVIEKIDESKIFVNLKVLLVDDNDMNQLVGSSVLETFGCHVDTASNGEIAVNILKEDPNHYDIVFMDVQMPVMNGYEATKIIREEISINLPIIAMTANTMSEDIKKAIESGMNSHIGKPINSEEIKSNIKRFCF